LHPDVNPDADADAMLRLNRAWAVLGVPARRRSYDRSLESPFPGGIEPSARPAEGPGDETGPGEDPGVPPLARFLRPSVVIIAVLLVIFLVTAYAGPGPGGRNPTGPPSSSLPVPTPAGAGSTGAGTSPGAGAPSGAFPGGTDPARLVGQCLRLAAGFDAVVSCSTANDGRVQAVADAAGACPPATRAYRLAAVAPWLCLDPNG
jgi:curved DNA-binding protein CbpA